MKFHYTIDDIRAANREAGFHFFSRDTIRFFNSRISEIVYQGPGGVYFVTSERYDSWTPRWYTVRRFDPETGNIHSASKFNELSKSDAHRLAADLAASNDG